MRLVETFPSRKGYKPPFIDDALNIISPHVVILGAGATIAALPQGDKNGKKQYSMNQLTQINNITNILEEHGIKANEIENFELFFSSLYSENPNSPLITKIEHELYAYYENMILPDEPTMYDYLVLSLTDKDLIATFNWDPFIDQAIARNSTVGRMPKIVHLHGCVNSQSRKLLYPTMKKDYAKIPDIKDAWDIFDDYLKRAICITIFGYSAPLSDIEARKRIKEKIEINDSNEIIDTQIIDIKPHEELEKTWYNIVNQRFFSSVSRFEDSMLSLFVRNTCEQYVNATMQQNPQYSNPYPDKKFETLFELQKFVKAVKIHKLSI